MQAAVTVVRDRWGVPHITASNTDDVFFAQGFVQAQDRLFQMDLWKRAAQGRLSEVLGANFIQRDSMTRRIQFRGDLGREWATYGPDAQRTAVAFTNGINAWVRMARADLPEEFTVAGWQPEFWRPEDLLNRTDAFLASHGALTELLRARLIASAGAARTNALLPSPGGHPQALDPDVDLSAITFAVSDAVRRIGTPPFFLTLAGPVSNAPRSGRTNQPSSAAGEPMAADPGAAASALPQAFVANLFHGVTWIRSDRGAGTAAAIGVEQVERLTVPSRYYLVHLTAPGLNVIGAARPWLPGVIIGHNERIAWAFSPVPIDTQDIFVERVNPADPHQVLRDGQWVDMAVDYDRVDVKGRSRPVEYERQYSSNGVVIAQDRQRGLVYTLRWTGMEPGGAGELATLALATSRSATEFRERLGHWTVPPAAFAFADTDGTVSRVTAGLAPIRLAGFAGASPTAGWVNARKWKSFKQLAAVPSQARTVGRDSNADTNAPDLTAVGRVERMVAGIIRLANPNWSSPRESSSQSTNLQAAGPADAVLLLYELLRQRVDAAGVPADLRDEVIVALAGGDGVGTEGGALAGKDGIASRDALSSALKNVTQRNVSSPRIAFEHPLAVFDESTRRFNIVTSAPRSDGAPGGEPGWVVAGKFGAPFRATFTPANWDRSVSANAPGQSGSPASAHYDDLVEPWRSGDDIILAFTQSAVESAATDRLVLQP